MVMSNLNLIQLNGGIQLAYYGRRNPAAKNLCDYLAPGRR